MHGVSAHILAESSLGWFVAVLVAVSCAAYAFVKQRQLSRLRSALDRGELEALEVGVGAIHDLQHAILREIRESQRRAAIALSQVEEMDTTLRATSIAVIALDVQQRVLRVNPAAERLLGSAEARSRGRLLQEVVRAPALNAFVDEALATGGKAAAQLELPGQDGAQDTMMFAASSEPLEMPEGRAGIVLSLVDITRARKLETMRSEFAANVSHELRTPITTIRGFVDTLAQLGRTDLDRSERYLAIVQRNVARLSAIVEDILMLSLLEDPARHAALDTKPLPLLEIMRECAEDLAHAAELRRVTLALLGQHEVCAVVNQSLAIQAVTNLLSNAIRHAPEQSTVTLRCITGNGEAGIEVIDRGAGIPSRHLERIFERFYRVDRARHRETGGTGLGLAIVKHIAQAHGGRVEAHSQVGEGSTFRIWFPTQIPAMQSNLNTN